jgi:hypothetical protein
MSFYSDASLVMIPSGYKDQKVYSAVPTDGSGDLVFSRASSATRVASDGLIEKVRTNILTYSNTFSDAAWVVLNSPTLTANYAANPIDGANDAWRFQAANDNDRIYQNYSGSFLNFSIYAKGSGTLRLRDNVGVFTDVTLTASWQRISLHFSTSISNVQITTGTSCDAVIYAAQLETGDIATDYIPTTTAAVSVGPVSGLPRLDYYDSTCPRLLLEPQRTNLALFSEQFDNAGWGSFTQGVGVAPVRTANYSIAPDGTMSADRLQCNIVALGGPNRSAVQQNVSVVSGTIYTFSMYVKSNTGASQAFTVQNSALNPNAGYDTQGTATSEWQRFVFVGTSVGTGTNSIRIGLLDSVVATSNDISIWGAQLEAGAYATSYIPTLGTSVTRVADAASKTGISSLIGQTEGTLFIDIDPQDISGSGRYISIEAASGIGSGWIGIFASGGTPNLMRFYGDGFDFSAGLAPRGVRTKAAFAYKNGVLTSAYVNGESVGTLTANTTGKSYEKLVLSSAAIGNAGCDNNYQTLIFKTALTNAQLAELTTL